MIKTLIKHTIAETAINTFFDKVANNFMCMNVHMFKKGDRYAVIETEEVYGNSQIITTYGNCDVISFRNKHNSIIVKYETAVVSTYINGIRSMGTRILTHSIIKLRTITKIEV